MAGLLSTADPNGLLEYSVVNADRALNPMSPHFQQVMSDIAATLKRVYRAHSAVIVPGSGTFGMEAVARQFASERRCLVIRTGDSSYRWSQMLDQGRIPADRNVRRAAREDEDDPVSPFAPPRIEEVIEAIRDQQPDIVFAPHVDASSGILLPDEYMRRIAEAIHEENGLFILDSSASGAAWVDMLDIGVDVLLSTPQGGWSSTPCCGMVMLSRLAREIIDETRSTSFACDLRQWLTVMETFEAGEHAYHASLPTDGLRQLRDSMAEIEAYGVDKLRDQQFELGRRVQAMLDEHGFKSVAAEAYRAPTVVTRYTPDAELVDRLAELGVQVTPGIPLMCGEGEHFRSLRIGLFGIDKLTDIDATLEPLQRALAQVAPAPDAAGTPPPE
ncbi:alanine--glyoxylate aminotransferase family protein [Halomonas sabkhae]|uniref:alanine--glyoxylate aminotransferase family protein n=1 Tax=Halomonas sabkhae TaxID=626223 RepID=UPI0025B2E6C3|nr:alanine--glyoxylate aminotransferase family protein [Halomonas sabkhae]MDN3525995.1 alanine--glyoxylate aminotransferase family protein [Halomonas sabkhae]